MKGASGLSRTNYRPRREVPASATPSSFPIQRYGVQVVVADVAADVAAVGVAADVVAVVVAAAAVDVPIDPTPFGEPPVFAFLLTELTV